MSTENASIEARNEAVVRAFLKAWDDLNLDACLAQVTEDQVWLDQGGPSLVPQPV